ncbi:thiamine phosphate synthase [Aquincola sp. MAHUQ-54]|uniref:Thiamine-phosphate synthase n=1 Tax=Aquincola agrisoli TaxID=3119538 RepID=A0AAW9QC28_9BURK
MSRTMWDEQYEQRVCEAFGVPAPTPLAAARALGFVEREAEILARMFEAQQHRLPAGASLAGFALQAGNLPVQRAAEGFAPLAERSMGLYAIVDSADWIERVLAAGVRTVQLRVKQAEPGRLAAEIARSVAAARAAGAQLFVNDHWREAIAQGAYGVHLGQEDLDTADLGAIRRAGLRLGVSTHAYWEVCRAWALRPSYIACGPIHATQLKVMPWTPQGEDNLAYWCALLSEVPVVGIGGMDAARCAEAMRCGADGVCVVSAVTGAADPEAAIAGLQAAVARGRAAPRRPVPMLARSTLRA